MRQRRGFVRRQGSKGGAAGVRRRLGARVRVREAETAFVDRFRPTFLSAFPARFGASPPGCTQISRSFGWVSTELERARVFARTFREGRPWSTLCMRVFGAVKSVPLGQDHAVGLLL